jgi:hypothetical protein
VETLASSASSEDVNITVAKDFQRHEDGHHNSVTKQIGSGLVSSDYESKEQTQVLNTITKLQV